MIDRRHLQQWISHLHIFQILLIIRLCLHIKNIPEILRIRQIINQVLIDLRLIQSIEGITDCSNIFSRCTVPSLAIDSSCHTAWKKQGILPEPVLQSSIKNRQFFTKFQIFKSLDQLPYLFFHPPLFLSCMLPVYLRKTL